MGKELKEKLAQLAHDQWAGWMDYLFSKCRESRPNDGDAFNEECLIIPPWAVKRWKRQASTPYDELSEEEKDSDRTEADKFLKVMESRQPDTELVEENKNLRIALIQHRADLHGASGRPCGTCQQSAEALGIKVPDMCARPHLDKAALAKHKEQE